MWIPYGYVISDFLGWWYVLVFVDSAGHHGERAIVNFEPDVRVRGWVRRVRAGGCGRAGREGWAIEDCCSWSLADENASPFDVDDGK